MKNYADQIETASKSKSKSKLKKELFFDDANCIQFNISNFPPSTNKARELYQRVKNVCGREYEIPNNPLFSNRQDAIDFANTHCRNKTHVKKTGDGYMVSLGYGGHGGPGILLEHLLGTKGGNNKHPDSGKTGIEIKFTQRKSLLTLFHLANDGGDEAFLPFVQKYGKQNKKQPQGGLRISATVTKRHKTFETLRKDGAIILRHSKNKEDRICFSENTLKSEIARKLEKVILVTGTVLDHPDGSRRVIYHYANFLVGVNVDNFINNIGPIIAVDLDASLTKDGNGFSHNHGEKFRMNVCNIEDVWEHDYSFDTIDKWPAK